MNEKLSLLVVDDVALPLRLLVAKMHYLRAGLAIIVVPRFKPIVHKVVIFKGILAITSCEVSYPTSILSNLDDLMHRSVREGQIDRGKTAPVFLMGAGGITGIPTLRVVDHELEPFKGDGFPLYPIMDFTETRGRVNTPESMMWLGIIRRIPVNWRT